MSDSSGHAKLRTVTSPGRGTQTERDLVLKLLRGGYSKSTLFHDLLIESSNGRTSQVDLVMATNEGIVVIEVKGQKGWIYGNGYNSNWTQVLNYGKNKYKFFNPIKQNEGHIKKLERLSPEFEGIPFFSLVVFGKESELKEISFIPNGTYVLKEHRIFEVLKHIKKTNPPAPFVDEQEVLKVLRNAVSTGGDKQKQKNHVAHVKDLVGEHRVYG